MTQLDQVERKARDCLQSSDCIHVLKGKITTWNLSLQRRLSFPRRQCLTSAENKVPVHKGDGDIQTLPVVASLCLWTPLAVKPTHSMNNAHNSSMYALAFQMVLALAPSLALLTTL